MFNLIFKPGLKALLWSMVLFAAAGLCSFGPASAREAAPLVSDPALEARVMELAEELRCLVCQNETIAASQADLAVELRSQIRQRLQGGESKSQIMDYMVARYGEFVRYKPGFSATTWLLWIGPFVMLAFAAFVLVANIRRQRRAAGSTSPGVEPVDDNDKADAAIDVKAVSRRTAFGLCAAVPLVAACVYMMVGNPAAATLDAAKPPPMAEPSSKDMDAMLDGFAKAMGERPSGRFEDLEGWVMLARTYASMKRFPEAANAFGKASALAPKDAQLLADWADVVAMQPDRKSAAEAASLVERALRLNPDNLKALALAGSGAYERKEFASAAAFWTRARSLAPPAGEFAAGLDKSIDEARAAAAGSKSTIDKLQP